ncbi:hypothetical protein KAR34_12530 [bacterium]|nr:hypothetical protein [bacterium]
MDRAGGEKQEAEEDVSAGNHRRSQPAGAALAVYYSEGDRWIAYQILLQRGIPR